MSLDVTRKIMIEGICTFFSDVIFWVFPSVFPPSYDMGGIIDRLRGPNSSFDRETRYSLEQFDLTRCVVRARPTGHRIGESPYGIVDEVSL